MTYNLNFNDANPQHTLQNHHIPMEDIRQALLNQLESVLSHLLPNGHKKYDHFLIGNVQGDRGKSLRVELQGPKAGKWHDFATGEGGDILKLWGACHDLDTRDPKQFLEVMDSVQQWLGYDRHEDSTSSISDNNQITSKWDYHDASGNLIACVSRYDHPDGKKSFRPWDVINQRYRAPDPRPLYNQPGILTADSIVLVEGEKCAQALIDQGIPATTAMHGAKAPVGKTDWSPLQGKRVIIWPDHDDSGQQYAQSAAEYLSKQGLASLCFLKIPKDKPEKWDAADAVAEGMDIQRFLQSTPRQSYAASSHLSAYKVGHYLADNSAMPEDLLAPRILTPGSLLLFGGAPKVGKSDFLMTLLAHMASGTEFLDMQPARPLRIFYLQAEIHYHYLRERLKNMKFDPVLLPLVKENLVITPRFNILFDEQGIDFAKEEIQRHFPDKPDVIAVDPLRNVFDGGPQKGDENDNTAMIFFLQKRLEALRDAVNPNAGLILVHHTRKITKNLLQEEPFQAISGASSLRGYYTSGMIMFTPDEHHTPRRLLFELRNGAKLPGKWVDKIDGRWQELNQHSERLVGKAYGGKRDAERDRQRDVILQMLYDEARKGSLYTANQFSETFENKAGLGGKDAIYERIAALATQGYIKYLKDALAFGFARSKSKFGFLCTESMELADKNGELHSVLPTHYKCPHSGAALPVENPRYWMLHDMPAETTS